MQESSIRMKNIPIEIETTRLDKNLMVTFKGDVYQSYENNLDEKNYKRYLKELRALFRDLDEIYGEINKKFGLKLF